MKKTKNKPANCLLCDDDAQIRGDCKRHYHALRHQGKLLMRPYKKNHKNTLQRRQKLRLCSVLGCQGTFAAKGYCYRHYQQIRRHGELTPERERPVYRRSLDKAAS